MSTNTPTHLYSCLLRPAVLHILRAAGFHSARPSVIDTLCDITARYILLLATRTAQNAYSNHNTLEPDITDVRMALQDCGLLVPSLTGAEEAWRERLRKPLEEYPERNGLRAKEILRRDAEDTQDVTEFLDWVRGEQHKEIRRIAGLEARRITETAELDAQEMEDYLNTLMKKHAKTGVESRFQGTVLGNPADIRPVRIEGGPVESIAEWCQRTQQKTAQEDSANEANENATEPMDTDPIQTNGDLGTSSVTPPA